MITFVGELTLNRFEKTLRERCHVVTGQDGIDTPHG